MAKKITNNLIGKASGKANTTTQATNVVKKNAPLPEDNGAWLAKLAKRDPSTYTPEEIARAEQAIARSPSLAKQWKTTTGQSSVKKFVQTKTKGKASVVNNPVATDNTPVPLTPLQQEVKDAQTHTSDVMSEKPIVQENINKAPAQFQDLTPAEVAQTPFDPAKVVQAQKENNLEVAGQNANLNRLNESNAFGSLEYVKNPDGTYTRKVTMSPEEQAILGKQQGFQQSLAGLSNDQLASVTNALNKYNYDSVKPLIGDQDYAAFRDKTTDQLYGAYEKKLNDRYAKEYNQYKQELADKGVVEGSEQWKNLTKNFEDNKSAAYQEALTTARERGGSEANSLFNMSLQGRQQGMSDITQQRNQPLSELSGMLALSRGAIQPDFQAYGNVNVANTDVGGINQGMLSLAQNQNQFGQNFDASQIQAQVGNQLALLDTQLQQAGLDENTRRNIINQDYQNKMMQLGQQNWQAQFKQGQKEFDTSAGLQRMQIGKTPGALSPQQEFDFWKQRQDYTSQLSAQDLENKLKLTNQYTPQPKKPGLGDQILPIVGQAVGSFGQSLGQKAGQSFF